MGTQAWVTGTQVGGGDLGRRRTPGPGQALGWGWRLGRLGRGGAVARPAEEVAVCPGMHAQVWRPGQGWSSRCPGGQASAGSPGETPRGQTAQRGGGAGMVRSLRPVVLLALLVLLVGLPAARDPREPDVFCGGECRGAAQAQCPRSWTARLPRPPAPHRKLSGVPTGPVAWAGGQRLWERLWSLLQLRSEPGCSVPVSGLHLGAVMGCLQRDPTSPS